MLKCFVACLFLLESQQPTCPQLRHSRKCTHVSPVCKHSSQPCALGVTSRIWSMCVQIEFIVTPLWNDAMAACAHGVVRSLMTGRDSLDQGIQLACLVEARVIGIYRK